MPLAGGVKWKIKREDTHVSACFCITSRTGRRRRLFPALHTLYSGASDRWNSSRRPFETTHPSRKQLAPVIHQEVAEKAENLPRAETRWPRSFMDVLERASTKPGESQMITPISKISVSTVSDARANEWVKVGWSVEPRSLEIFKRSHIRTHTQCSSPLISTLHREARGTLPTQVGLARAIGRAVSQSDRQPGSNVSSRN